MCRWLLTIRFFLAFYVFSKAKEQVEVKITLDINNNNNNNNLFLRSLPSQHTKLMYETPLFVGQWTPQVTAKPAHQIGVLDPLVCGTRDPIPSAQVFDW